MRNFALIILVSSLPFCVVKGQDQGADTVKVQNTNQFPNNSICQLKVKRRGIKTLWLWKTINQSTGFYIDTNLILTNAHNLYSNFWSRVTYVEVYRGRSEDSFPFIPDTVIGKKEVMKRVRVADEYKFLMKAEKRGRYDFAVLYIDSKEKTDSLLGLKPASPELFVGKGLSVIGYPGETKNGKEQYISRGLYSKENKWNIYYEGVFTETGNSGSPILTQSHENIVIIGVHAFPGKGVKITNSIIEKIKTWQVELERLNPRM